LVAPWEGPHYIDGYPFYRDIDIELMLLAPIPGFSGKIFWTLEIPFKTGFAVINELDVSMKYICHILYNIYVKILISRKNIYELCNVVSVAQALANLHSH
jgi:hypothetical protein